MARPGDWRAHAAVAAPRRRRGELEADNGIAVSYVGITASFFSVTPSYFGITARYFWYNGYVSYFGNYG